MSPVRNARVIFGKFPEEYPIPGETVYVDHSQTIDLDAVDLSGGKILAKTLAISVDPYLRGKMRPERGPYAFIPGKPVYGVAVVKVLRSENPKVKVGDHLYNPYGDSENRPDQMDWAEYQVLGNADDLRILSKNTNIPWTDFLGPVGMPAETAFYGWKEINPAPKKGETIYVSSAAGGVGSIVVQLAKEAGLKVIGSAGSESKLQQVRDLGADVVFNYKTTAIHEVLGKHGPVDIYWDHVGGESLSAVLPFMNAFGRIQHIGMTPAYNKAGMPAPIDNYFFVLFLRLTLRGINCTDYYAKYEKEFFAKFTDKVARGEIKYNWNIVKGLDAAPQLLTDVQKGNVNGKGIIVLAVD